MPATPAPRPLRPRRSRSTTALDARSQRIVQFRGCHSTVGGPLMWRIPFLLLLGSTPAFAQSARICLLVDETHDEKKSPAGAGEARLAEGLLAAGYALVERYDADQA